MRANIRVVICVWPKNGGMEVFTKNLKRKGVKV